MLGGYPRRSTVSRIISRIRRCRRVRPSPSSGPSGNELTEPPSPSWAATSLVRGRPRRRPGGGDEELLSAMCLTIGKTSDKFKHLFERVGKRSALVIGPSVRRGPVL